MKRATTKAEAARRAGKDSVKLSNKSDIQSICYVVGAGETQGFDFVPGEDDYVIAVDGGYRYLEQAGMRIDLVVGDFDSLQYRPQHPRVLVLNPEKNDTDMRSAILEGVRGGYDIFHIYGGTGGRMDHTIANIQLLAELSRDGRQGFLFGGDYVLTALTDGALTFPGETKGYVSVFSHSDQAIGVSLSGLKYRLEGAVLQNTYPLGVSNEFTGAESMISVEKGTLLICYPKEVGEARRCGAETGI